MSAKRTEYDEAAEAAIRAIVADPFRNNPALTDDSVAKTLAKLMQSDDERIQLGAIKAWATLRQMADRQGEQQPETMEEILRQESKATPTSIPGTSPDLTWTKNPLGPLPGYHGRQ